MADLDFQITSSNGGVFGMSSFHRFESILNSPLFSPEERIFLKDSVEQGCLEFTLSIDGFMNHAVVYVMRLYHDPELVGDLAVNGKVLFLHDSVIASSSWCFIKFARSIYRQGFDVELVDLPGNGRSSVGGSSHKSRLTGSLLSGILQGKGGSHLVAFGSSCDMIIDLFDRNHYLIGPCVVFLAPLFTDSKRIIKILRKGLQGRILIFLFNTLYTNQTEYETNSEICKKIKTDPVLGSRITLVYPDNKDLEICSFLHSQVNSLPSVLGLNPSRYFRVYMTQFLLGTRMPPYENNLHASGIEKVVTQTLNKHPASKSFGARLKEESEMIEMDTVLQKSLTDTFQGLLGDE